MSEGEASTDRPWRRADFSDAIHRGGACLRAWSPRQRSAKRDELCRAFGGTAGPVVSIDDLFARVHAEGRDAMMRDWLASATETQPYSFGYRIGDEAGARRVIGTGRKRAEEAERLLTVALAHRVSNMLTVARALTAIVARDARSAATFAEDLSRRFSVPHEATIPASRSPLGDQGDVGLQQLAERILAPYRDGADLAVTIASDVFAVPGQLNDHAMIFHELAINAAKYGALSEGGVLRVRGSEVGRTLRRTWDEGPARSGTRRAGGAGFGSRLLRQTIERSLGGRFARDIGPSGLHFERTVPAG